jgi:ribosome-binding ATPase
MSLSVGIVGLPNVGKSTLFNALLKKQQALAANYPFATIEPNVGIVAVADERLQKLSEIYNAPIVPATVEFVDIAGLVKGASEGAGLGNKFLAHIREVDAVCHVVRAFGDEDVIREGASNPKDDFELIKTELELADFETVSKHEKKKNADVEALQLLAKKPFLVVLNVDEDELKDSEAIEKKYAEELGISEDQVVTICAKLEEQLMEFGDEEAKEYLDNLGIANTAIDRLTKKAYKTLGLISFLTAGEKEMRAWTIKEGTNAQMASGAIHKDFVKKFIKAEVVNFEDFVSSGGWKNVKEKGFLRLEGKDYIVQDGDVVDFKIGS